MCAPVSVTLGPVTIGGYMGLVWLEALTGIVLAIGAVLSFWSIKNEKEKESNTTH